MIYFVGDIKGVDIVVSAGMGVASKEDGGAKIEGGTGATKGDAGEEATEVGKTFDEDVVVASSNTSDGANLGITFGVGSDSSRKNIGAVGWANFDS